MSRLRGAVALLAGLGLVVAAWLVMNAAPTQQFSQRPVEVRVQVGERGEGRNVAATVHEVVIAEALTNEDDWNPWNGTTTGVWIIVSASVETIHDGGSLNASLDYGGLTVPASPRSPVRSSLQARALAAGIAQTGWLAFEVPGEMPIPETVVVRIADTIDTRLDTVIVVPLDLVDAERTDEFVLPRITSGVIR